MAGILKSAHNVCRENYDFPVTVVQSPKQEVSRGWISRFGLMYLGQNIAWAAPTNLLLSAQILVWFPEDKERQLALLMTAGGLVSLLASPLVGIFSDRTRSSLGRRTPWIIAGITIASVALGGPRPRPGIPAPWVTACCWRRGWFSSSPSPWR